MSDNELDDLLAQLKDTCKKNRHHSLNDTNFNHILKKIDVFINRRQMKLLNHQKRLEDLQRDLLVSESESSRNRLALQKKDFEVNQLHTMLNKAEQTTQTIMTRYETEVQQLTRQLSTIQKEYDRLHQTVPENRSTNEMTRLRELNKKLEIDNRRLMTENDQSKQQREIEILRLESEQHRHEFETHRKNLVSDEVDKVRLLLTDSEQQCKLLRFDLQRVKTEKEILKVRLLEQNHVDNSVSDIENHDYEKFIRNELEINIDQANQLITYWNSHKLTLEDKIRHLTNEIHQLKKEKKTKNENNLSFQLSHYNENILHAKRERNSLQMEITDKNTIIYNLYKKIECLEQALTISKQRTTSQLKEIEDLRLRNSKSTLMFNERISTDDDGQMRQLRDSKRTLCTSSPIKSADLQKHFHSASSPSIGIRTTTTTGEQFLFNH